MNLSDKILAGAEAKQELIAELSRKTDIPFECIEVECDTYDNSLEIYFTKNEEVDIELFFNDKGAALIEEVSGNHHFWLNLCIEDLEYDEKIEAEKWVRYKYKDCHSGWLKHGLQETYQRVQKTYLTL